MENSFLGVLWMKLLSGGTFGEGIDCTLIRKVCWRLTVVIIGTKFTETKKKFKLYRVVYNFREKLTVIIFKVDFTENIQYRPNARNKFRKSVHINKNSKTHQFLYTMYH